MMLRRYALLTVGVFWLGFPIASADEPTAERPVAEFAPDQVDYYLQEVQPLLQQHCYKCHGPEERKGGLRLTTREGLLKGGDSGPAIDTDSPADSLLLEALRYESYEMPPAGKLPDAQIATVEKWLGMGAPFPQDALTEAEETGHGVPQVNEQTKSHWSFQPVQRPEPPPVADESWPRNEIDRFILARLEQAGLTPAPPADPQSLIRRLHYDLVGLPPSAELVERFVNDPSDAAYEALVDELLDSPHYGEHWARYWLDLVRYAETNSFERDNPKPFVWRYRDYVIRSFNADKPYDQFLREQLAGDELDEVTPETIIATGFYRLGLWDDEPADPELHYFDQLDDIAATTAQAMLGLTMNCARCHDHKLDPIPQADYYRFIAFFRNVRRYGIRADPTVYERSVCSIATPEQQQAHELELKAHEEQIADFTERMEQIESLVKPHLKGGEIDDFQDERSRQPILKKYVGEQLTQEQFTTYVQLRKQREHLRANPPESGALALCVKERGSEAPPTHILIRGNPHVEGDEVEPAFPSVLSPPTPEIEPPDHGNSTGRRRALAQWITGTDNPLTARVMVNRLWQWHFGRGIVRSPNNFGLQGIAPTHPDLLDWLAAEFMDNDWRIKSLHKQIVMSQTYRMASQHPDARAVTKSELPEAAKGTVDSPANRGEQPGTRADAIAGRQNTADASATAPANPQEVDPENDLFWRFDMRRLRAEEVRDSILAAAGNLNLDDMYGPSVYPIIPPEVLAGQSRPGQGWGQSPPDQRFRRSVYIHLKRSLVVPLMAAYDVADTDSTCPVRFATTQPTQALTMLNSEFLNKQAEALSQSVRQEAKSTRDRVEVILTRVLQRSPSAAEVDRGVSLIRSLRQSDGLGPNDALHYFCLMALNLNEFLYLD